MDPIRTVVGERLRAARSARGLSLGSLAARAGIGKGSLSEIESGSRNPTLSTLYALANTLEMPLSRLLADGPGAEVASPGITARLLETTTGDEGTVEVYALTLDPGTTHVSAAHGAGVVEHVLIVRGRARVGRAGHESDVDAGGHAAWTSDVDHTYRALDGRPAEAVLVIRSPAADGSPEQ